jgi:hypothetical protein
MPRKRSFIFDSSTSSSAPNTMYVGIDSIANANTTTIAAGTIAAKKLRSVEIKPYGSTVQVVSGTNEWYLNNDIVVSSIFANLRGQSNFIPQGRDMIISMRKNHASNGVTTVFQTLTITKATANVRSNTTLTASTGDKIYFDVTQVGSTIPGMGLKLDITYY